MPALALLVVACSLVAACRKGDIAAVQRPVVPIWVCKEGSPEEGPCEDRFDVGRLIALDRTHAERIAGDQGYEIRCAAGVGPKELAMDYSTRRLDVECRGDPGDPIVVRFIRRG